MTDAERLLAEINRLRGELETVIHVCRNQGLHASGRPIDAVVGVIEGIARKALDPRRDGRLPGERGH